MIIGGVDIFFFVSGFGLFFSLNKNNAICYFYKRRLLRIIPLCVICGLLRYVIDHILPVGKGGYPTGIHEVSTDWTTILSWDKWFIPVILIYYLLMPFLNKIFKDYGKNILWVVYLLWAVSFILTVYHVTPSYIFFDYMMRFPSFCMGVLSACSCFMLTKQQLWIGLIPVFCATLYKFMMMVGFIEDGSVRDSFNFLLLSLSIVPVCVCLAKGLSFLERHSVGNVIIVLLQFLGRHSLELYLVHEFIYRYMYRFLINTSLPLIVQMIIAILLSIMIATTLGMIAKRTMRMLVVSN